MAAPTSSLASTQSPAHNQNPVAVQNLSDSVSRVTAEDNASSTNKAAIFQRLHPRVYLERFLAEGVRPDGRSLWATDSHTGSVISEGAIWREVSINVENGQIHSPSNAFSREYQRTYLTIVPGSIGTADGSALVRMGGTTVVCGVKAEIAEPDLEKPDEGFLVPNIDLPAMCHPRFRPGPPSDQAQVLSERLFETLILAKIIPLQTLVIRPGKAVWTLYVDATCINYDGNVFDAALIAMVSALLNVRLPKAIYDEELGQTICHREPKTPLTINSLPLSMSFGIFNSTHILADPTAFEEPLLGSTVTIVTGEDSTSEVELLNIIQYGLGIVNPSSKWTSSSGAMADNALSACIRAAKTRRYDLSRIVREAIGLKRDGKIEYLKI